MIKDIKTKKKKERKFAVWDYYNHTSYDVIDKWDFSKALQSKILNFLRTWRCYLEIPKLSQIEGIQIENLPQFLFQHLISNHFVWRTENISIIGRNL